MLVAAGIILLSGLCWWFLLNGAGMGPNMAMRGMTMQPPFASLVAMWWLMMMAMMLPSAAPAILLYARVHERNGSGGRVVRPWLFAAGYVAVWLLFAIAASWVQQRAADADMAIADRRAGAALLIAAGLYQLSPLKAVCLRQCRSPAQFLVRHWRPGAVGAVRLGLIHGGYCLGCCWLLMALLFVGGVMYLIWIVALTIIVAIEKLVPHGEWLGRAVGLALVVSGAAMLT